MASTSRWSCWLRLIITAAAVSMWWRKANSQPQINLLNKGCSQYNASNAADFFNNLNATFSDLRSQLLSGTLFATAEQARSSDPVYAMVQCRNYMTPTDCLACYDAAVSQIRNCSAANGARVIYDGCFLRYESNNFYDQTTLPGNVQICGNRTAPQPAEFAASGEALLRDLEVATPRTKAYYAASKRAVGNFTVYGVAQCAQTITQAGCQDCLTVAYRNIESCLPDADGRAIDAACFLRYSDTPFFADNQTTNITPFLGAGGNSSKKKAIIGGVVAAGALVLILAAFLLWYKFARKPETAPRSDILGATELQGPNRYSYKDLKAATSNFSEENKLGEGGFGDVYKATLKNGNVVAVKKLNISYSRAKADFETEVRLISNVHHRNLVRLLGCCNKGPDLLLVYEYMENGSLDRFLYGDKRGSLSWKQRFDILFGTARGLAYLHEQYHVTIIHRDVKPSNILLDKEFQAKIADFGLARLLPENQSHVSTNFAGTLGYTAPEYAIHGHLSEKVDTYSFGVVILEMMSGKRSSHMNMDTDTEYLLEEAWKLYESGLHEKLADATLESSEYKVEELKKMVEIGLMCTQSPASSRPSMSEIVVMMLSDGSLEGKAPSRGSVSYGNRVGGETSTSVSTGSSVSNATNSFTRFTGR
ncbi:cold-responsive protein kinase 1-like isoform X2 [Salvia miltiorrhiza]|uniref:cold-responsive protein kinase 1-like isoform X2 n=1 Tax=Salvia miltiorrhiza TaxID=226208 RepID=UPI0025ACF16C|nr:cold-responsive protein kinase 1-like isoform X2 [Salvia miltiorrhiza]